MDHSAPKKDECLRAADSSPEVLRFLAKRRSGLVRGMSEPGPDKEQLNLILRLGARVPDHRKLFPWRFILFQGEARAAFGEKLADKFVQDRPGMPKDRIEHERTRFLRAPLVIAVVSSPKDCPRGTPKWEQELSAGAVCQNMLLAARASGFAAQWLTEWYAFDEYINQILDLTQNERMAGFIYIGTASEQPMERPRPDMANIVINWHDH